MNARGEKLYFNDESFFFSKPFCQCIKTSHQAATIKCNNPARLHSFEGQINWELRFNLKSFLALLGFLCILHLTKVANLCPVILRPTRFLFDYNPYICFSLIKFPHLLFTLKSLARSTTRFKGLASKKFKDQREKSNFRNTLHCISTVNINYTETIIYNKR